MAEDSNGRPGSALPISFAPVITPASYKGTSSAKAVPHLSPNRSQWPDLIREEPEASSSSPTTTVAQPQRSPRATHKRTRRGADPQHIPRPANAFFLFRSAFIKQQYVPSHVVSNCADLSQVISRCWQELSFEEREYWQARAQKEREEHQAMFPNYRYRPSQPKDSAGRTGCPSKKRAKAPAKEDRKIEDVAQLLMKGKRGAELADAMRDLERTRDLPTDDAAQEADVEPEPEPPPSPERGQRPLRVRRDSHAVFPKAPPSPTPTLPDTPRPSTSAQPWAPDTLFVDTSFANVAHRQDVDTLSSLSPVMPSAGASGTYTRSSPAPFQNFVSSLPDPRLYSQAERRPSVQDEPLAASFIPAPPTISAVPYDSASVPLMAPADLASFRRGSADSYSLAEVHSPTDFLSPGVEFSPGFHTTWQQQGAPVSVPEAHPAFSPFQPGRPHFGMYPPSAPPLQSGMWAPPDYALFHEAISPVLPSPAPGFAFPASNFLPASPPSSPLRA